MAPKDQFLRQTELVKASLAILKSDSFEQLMVYAKAEFASHNPTNEQMTGANTFERVLLDMVNRGGEVIEFPTPGLEHNLEVERAELSNQAVIDKRNK